MQLKKTLPKRTIGGGWVHRHLVFKTKQFSICGQTKKRKETYLEIAMP